MIRLHRKLSPILSKIRYQSQSTDNSFLRAIQEPSRSSFIAIIDEFGSTTYGDLDLQSGKLAHAIISKGLLSDKCQTIASFNDSNRNYVISMLATWKLGRRFLPLCPSHTEHELSYFIKDSHCGLVIHSKIRGNDKTNQLMLNFGVNAINTSDAILISENDTPTVLPHQIIKQKNSDTGLIVYTSGTTGKPKGVLHDESNIIHMIKGLVQAWEYTQEDKILHFLPLHHVHGILNKLLCMLYVGGTIEFLSNAKAPTIWKRLSQEYIQQSQQYFHNNKYKKLSLFMAVPTVYAKMIEELKLYGMTHQLPDHAIANYKNILNLPPTPSLATTTTPSSTSTASSNHHGNKKENEQLTLQDYQQGLQVLSNMRLNVSGSAAMPEPIFKQWQTLTNQVLLERYGMTEIGMALSNPYHTSGLRLMGSVGMPLPYVECRLVDDHECEIQAINTPGELRVKVSVCV